METISSGVCPPCASNPANGATGISAPTNLYDDDHHMQPPMLEDAPTSIDD